jgi:peptidoglycan hydrolase CwlO-like protein
MGKSFGKQKENKRITRIMETLKNFFIKNYKTTLVILLVLFLLYWVLFIVGPSSTMSKEDKAKLDSLTNVVNKINEEQTILENKIETVNREVDKIDNNISKIKVNKEKTGKKYHEEINRVDKYTEPELDSFFTNRY